VSILSHNLKNGRFLTLRQHLEQIRAAAAAIRERHSARLLRECAEVWNWLEECIRLHDTGKGSGQFQSYIRDPEAYVRRHRRETKSHTPLSTLIVLALAHDEGWDWQRAFAVAQIASGHHGALETRNDMSGRLYEFDAVLGAQMPTVDWAALEKEVHRSLRTLVGMAAEHLLDHGTNQLDDLFDLAKKSGDVRFRLLCQLAFSVLLEADKAFLAVPEGDLPRYVEARRPALDPGSVDKHLARKPKSNVNPLREEARRELLAGMERAGSAGVQTLTLPTGTGKTLLAATWALRHRAERGSGGPPPLVLVVLPYLSIIDQTTKEYEGVFDEMGLDPGDLISYHSLSDRTYDPNLEDKSQDFFLDTWHSSVVITTFDQFCLALLSPRGKHQMRFHHLADAVIVLDEVQTLPPRLWAPLQAVLDELVRMGTTRILAMSATQPGFLPNACELVADPASVFRQMQRYRLVLRHGTSMRLSDFARACVSRLPDWRERKVLITLNTRRSARAVMEALRQAGQSVEFLTADVTPADRLSAVDRIKDASSCLVVSTQCIEAGVDIDMDVVIRDFGPLDSIVQVAGRCNRNGKPGRGTVEVVLLREDDRETEFASYIYDPVLREVTGQVLAGREEVLEEEVFSLTHQYFDGLRARKNTGEDFLRAWAGWEETDSVKRLLRGPERPQVAFVVIEEDPGLRGDLEAAQRIEDRWQRRRAFRRLAARVARVTVSVFLRRGFEPSNYGEPFPQGQQDDDAWFWLLRPGLYTVEGGMDLGVAAQEQEGWGVIL
jgi:CRISPR-associated endonuclease/helicase Cas3